MLTTSRLLVIFLLIYGWTLNAQDAPDKNQNSSGNLIAGNRQPAKLTSASVSKLTTTSVSNEQIESLVTSPAQTGLLDSVKVQQPDALNNMFAMQLALLQSHSVIPSSTLLAHQYFYRLGNQVAQPGFPLQKKTAESQEDITSTPKSVEAAEEIFANGIYFESGSARLLDKSKPQLNKIYNFLQKHPDKRLSLVAMQETGTRTNTLMFVRARAVQNYLVRMGLDPDRVRVKKEAFSD